MRTRFDSISDDDIDRAVALVLPHERYPERESDLRRIAHLVWWMHYWKSWLGPPVTYFSDTDFDGHHRTRAAKYIAKRFQFQIQIPVRYAP